MIIKTSTRKSPYSSASGLILRFFKISLTSDVQSCPKVQDSSLKLLQDPLQLHLLRFAGHENKTHIHIIFPNSWPKQRKNLQIPDSFPPDFLNGPRAKTTNRFKKKSTFRNHPTPIARSLAGTKTLQKLLPVLRPRGFERGYGLPSDVGRWRPNRSTRRRGEGPVSSWLKKHENM